MMMKLGKKKATKETSSPEVSSRTGLAKWEAFLSQEQVPPPSEKNSKKGSKTPTLSKKSADDAKKESKKDKKDKEPKKASDKKDSRKGSSSDKKESKRDSKSVQDDTAPADGEEEKIDQKMAQLKALDGWVTSAQTRAAVSLAASSSPGAYGDEEGDASSGPYAEGDELDGSGSPIPRKVLRRSSAASVADAVVVDMADGRPTLRAGTFQGIVKWLIFQNVGDLSTSFLLTFRAYGTPQELWEALMNVFRIIHEKDLKENARKDMRRRVIGFLEEWIRRFSYSDFIESNKKSLFKDVTTFVKALPAEESRQLKLLLMRKKTGKKGVNAATAKEAGPMLMMNNPLSTSSSNALGTMGSGSGFPIVGATDAPSAPGSGVLPPPTTPTAAGGGAAAAGGPAPLPGDSLGASSALVLKRTSAKALAQQMTLLDATTFSEIKPEEMLLGNWTRPNKEEVAPTLTYLANYFNQWSYWVSTDILNAGSLNGQVQAVKKFISVLHHLFSLNNFNSLMAVMSGLNRAAVSRLKKVWARVPIKFVELFHQLEDLMTPLGNFKYYRQLLAESRDKRPIVPYLVVFLRDLTFINDGNEERLPMPQKPEIKLPNFEKMVLLGQQILELEAYRKVPYTLDADSAVTNALRNVMYLDEDTLHRRSVEQEPIQNLEGTDMEFPDDEQISNEKKTKNPLLALQQMREELLAESNEFDFSEGSETSWAPDEDKTDDGTAPKFDDKSE
jgi:hypothetical protein